MLANAYTYFHLRPPASSIQDIFYVGKTIHTARLFRVNRENRYHTNIVKKYGKEGGNTMKRWHFDNCRIKVNL